MAGGAGCAVALGGMAAVAAATAAATAVGPVDVAVFAGGAGCAVALASTAAAAAAVHGYLVVASHP
jgi:hypothetical protein